MKKFYAIALGLMMGFSANTFAQKTVYLSSTSKIDFSKVTLKTTTVSLSRTFYAGYNTICLPFSVSSDELKQLVGEGVMLEHLAKVEGSTLVFLDVTDQGIQAGLPYLIYSPKTQSVRFTTNDMVFAALPTTVTVGGVTMSGNYEPKKDFGLYGIPAAQDTDILQAVLIRTEGDKTFLPTRCGFNIPESIDNPVISHVTSLGNTTAINKLMADNAKVSVYTIGGSLVKKNIRINDAMNTLTPGIYVINNQKVVIK